MTSEYIPCATGARSQVTVTGPCEARGCTGDARGGKPYCADHVELNPYAASVIGAMAAIVTPVWQPRVDLAGMKFSRWSVVRLAAEKRGYWQVVCECGHESRVAGTSLVQKKSRGCRPCAMRDRHNSSRCTA